MKRNLFGYILSLALMFFAFYVIGCAKKIITEPTKAQEEAIEQILKKELMEINEVEKRQEVKTSKPQEIKISRDPEITIIEEPIKQPVIDDSKKWNKFTYEKEKERYLCDEYVVGTWKHDRDCLWNIAKKPEIYNNAWLWVDIYQANKDQIKNPDLIYPGQVLRIPRNQ